MPAEYLTPRDLADARREVRDSAAGMGPFSVGRPWRVTDPHAPMPWRVTTRLGSIVRVDRYRDEPAAEIGRAQSVADVILLADRTANR
jgi:hypothetical protein